MHHGPGTPKRPEAVRGLPDYRIAGPPNYTLTSTP